MNSFLLDCKLVFRTVIRQRRRSSIAIGAIGFGVAALILANGFIESILLDFREDTIASQLGHLQIVRPGYHNEGKANPYAFLLPDTIPEIEASTDRRVKVTVPGFPLAV